MVLLAFNLWLVGEVSAQFPDILEDGDVVLAAVVPELAGGEAFLQDQRRPDTDAAPESQQGPRFVVERQRHVDDVGGGRSAQLVEDGAHQGLQVADPSGFG